MGVVTNRIVSGDVEIRTADRRGNRQNAAAKCLAQDEDVRRDAIMLTGEHGASLAKSGRNFIEDQQGAVIIASRTHGLPEPGWR